ncbi:hypothetical protein [Herminiimonas sp. KBW02]|uniref:hypothetical protein n=1 Tax=Herminiimonas sp. KBW02 TaxID=2153363 RepID=UPI0018F52340|nr:hypothetical protein [Herminiimonas sp. KBW02]
MTRRSSSILRASDGKTSAIFSGSSQFGMTGNEKVRKRKLGYSVRQAYISEARDNPQTGYFRQKLNLFAFMHVAAIKKKLHEVMAITSCMYFAYTALRLIFSRLLRSKSGF